jgi:hypothetical protein
MWKEDDTVTTTYRTLAKASAEAFEMGEGTERLRVLNILRPLASAPGCFEPDWKAILELIEHPSN